MRLITPSDNFNSRPSARGDVRRPRRAVWLRSISIHAPPRGATAAIAQRFATSYFNSRPSARGDWRFRHRLPVRHKFQFTPLREGRQRPIIGTVFFEISIHAPPRGATIASCNKVNTRRFQFTPLREGRLSSCVSRGDANKFQFTPLREGRRKFSRAHHVSAPRFQFTPLREGRRHQHAGRHHQAISIHAPPRGATASARFSQSSFLFQFTPLREGRPRRMP